MPIISGGSSGGGGSQTLAQVLTTGNSAGSTTINMNSNKITSVTNGTAAQDAAAFGQLNQLLAVQVYAPGSQTIKSITAATLTAFDTTNLTVAFTVPLSGKVLVRFTGMVALNGSFHFNIGLFAHSTSNVVGFVYSDFGASSTSGVNLDQCYEWYITGLTPGASLQYDLMGAITGGNTLAVFAYGPTAVDLVNPGGPAKLEVWGM